MITLKKILSGDKPSLARAISLIENLHTPDPSSAKGESVSGGQGEKAVKLLSLLHPYLGKAHRIGVTGPPGVGKSTLVDELTRTIRQRNKTVGIIAIDPTSIFSGGAILGDRIRMQKIGVDNGVYIRSMATRGWRGGISRTTSDVADILDASDKSYVIIETVGVGQSEVEIFKNVDTTILVLSPESGDAIQMMKAGIMEIADLIIVNKADRPGAEALINAIRNTPQIVQRSSPASPDRPPGRTPARLNESFKQVRTDRAGRQPVVQQPVPILKTEAINSVGITEVVDYLKTRWEQLKKSGELERKRRSIMEAKLKSLVLHRLEEKIWQNKKIARLINQSIDNILGGKDSPHQAVERIIKSVLSS